MPLRPAIRSDFDAIYDIYMDHSVNPFMLYDPMDKESFRAVFDGIMSRDCVWVFEDQKAQVIGMCSAVLGKGRMKHVASVFSLGIKSDFQGQGIGRIMLSACIEELTSKGITRIELGVESDNARGLAFYEALGFVNEGRLKNYLKRAGEEHFVDEVLMAYFPATNSQKR